MNTLSKKERDQRLIALLLKYPCGYKTKRYGLAIICTMPVGHPGLHKGQG